MTALKKPTSKDDYQPFTSPAFKGLSCLGGHKVIISKDAQKVVERLSPSGKASVNNQMSCITKSNASTIGSHKLYIELTEGLLELTVRKHKKLNQLQIESARELKGLRKPWAGSRISLPNQWSITKNGYTYKKLYYSNPVYSYPEEPLNRFLLRVAPEFHRLSNSKNKLGSSQSKVDEGAEYTSAIFISKGSVIQYSLIVETQGLPALSIATRPAPKGFKTMYNLVGGSKVAETVHTHGEMRWRLDVPTDTKRFIRTFAKNGEHEAQLMAVYYTPFEQSISRIAPTVKGDQNNFSTEDYKAHGWLVTDKRCLLFQEGKGTSAKKGCF